MDELIKKRVHDNYWINDFNCATTTLKIMAEYYDISLSKQVIDAAVGMHGAGGYQAQCGIVEGTLMFIGILGREKSIRGEDIIDFCKDFAQAFETEFKSLSCKILRPEGFKLDNPPHLCESLTVKGTIHNIRLISKWLVDKGILTKDNQPNGKD